MKTLMFFNNKGGVGKTSSVTAIAHMLAKLHGKRVLIVDLDPQMNTTMMFSEVDFIDLFKKIRYEADAYGTGHSVEDLLMDRNMDIHDCILHTAYEGLDLIPAYLTLSEAEERLKADVKTPQQFRLKQHLKDVRNEYDYCIIDASPSVSILNINGLAAADKVYIPVRCDGGSLLGVSISMNLYETVSEYNPCLEIGGIFFTQWNGRKNVSRTVYEILEQEYGSYLIPVQIPAGKVVEESSLVQVPLLEYDSASKKSKVTESYMELVDFILKQD
ncbi:MAG: AAA family ATPase [Lachnospiraceae bacterium]|nr:AAA family ATPase [Lachnospiraceae bacterium]